LFRGLTPLIRLEVAPQFEMSETFRVESCWAARFRGVHTDEECRFGRMWSLEVDLVETRPAAT